MTAAPSDDDRRVLFIVGSGRSGTSTLAGSLQRLNVHVPQPEIAADNTNPRGFGESRWVVRFHERLLGRANVSVGDARPQAWLATSNVGNKDQVRERARDWLESTCTPEHPEIVLKDPRIGWFLSLWKATTIRCDIPASYAVMLRPPAETVGSKQTYYSSSVSATSRAAGWVNHMLHTERATRGERRAFLRYHDLLEDWTVPVFRIGQELGVAAVRNASAKDIVKVHDFVDPSLRRITEEDHPLELPERLGELVTATWEQLSLLADPQHDVPETHARLDELREAYTALYRESEAITESTAHAERRAAERARKDEPAEPHARDEEPARAPRLRLGRIRARRVTP